LTRALERRDRSERPVDCLDRSAPSHPPRSPYPRRPWGTLVPKRSDEARTAPQLAVNAVIKGETFDRFGVTRGRDNDDLR